MNTQTLNSVKPSVGQLDKTGLPTPKPFPYKENPVGGHQDENPRAHARTREESAMGYLCELLESLEELNPVVFHEPSYLNEIHTTYSGSEARFFVQWVKSFALMRCSKRPQPIEGVIQTTDQDFLCALTVMQLSLIHI